MIKWLLRRRLAAFERAWNYDASYMHEVLDADPSALMAFSKVASLGRYHKDAPLAAYHAVRVVGTMAEDCGPCTQLTVDMAVRAGSIRRFCGPWCRGSSLRCRPTFPWRCVSPRRACVTRPRRTTSQEVVRRWGKWLAFAITGARIFPTVKYAMGHGRACTRVTVAGESRPVLRELTRAA
jgi:hypothetical protein